MVEVHSKDPKDCNPQELAAFTELVLEGGEAAAAGLPGRVQGAVALAFLTAEQGRLGVAGLKRPKASYRTKVAQGSGIELPEERFPFELGWVYVRKGIRGGKSKMLCEPLIPYAEREGVFATSRTNNPWMHATLLALGFARVGSEWPSDENPASLALFIREGQAQ
jgi:hypothetical protein